MSVPQATPNGSAVRFRAIAADARKTLAAAAAGCAYIVAAQLVHGTALTIASAVIAAAGAAGVYAVPNGHRP